MGEALSGAGLAAKVLTVSDGVVHGTREDLSGVALEEPTYTPILKGFQLGEDGLKFYDVVLGISILGHS